jgi:1-acyl-sn-glycerol-3-phosphate acyltransferase
MAGKQTGGRASPATRQRPTDGRSHENGVRALKRAREGWSVDGNSVSLLNRQAPLWNFLMDHYFRLETEGWHRVPDRAAMFVGVHSGGTIAIDGWLFVFQWWRRFGEQRIIHATAHDVLMSAPGLGHYFRACGVLPASKEAITASFEAGHDLVIWPGGEFDALRRWDKRDRAILGGRTGFLRLAAQLGVPVVPYASTGGADTGIVLSEGRELARLLNTKERLRSEILPIVLAPPFGATIEILPTHLPMAAKIRYEILDPIELDPDRADDRDYLRERFAEVEGAIQGGMDRLARRRSFPIFG